MFFNVSHMYSYYFKVNENITLYTTVLIVQTMKMIYIVVVPFCVLILCNKCFTVINLFLFQRPIKTCHFYIKTSTVFELFPQHTTLPTVPYIFSKFEIQFRITLLCKTLQLFSRILHSKNIK